MCAKQPWAGISGTYEASRDPWKRSDLAAFRREFYQKTMQWLASPGSRTYPVNEVFVWGMASWDMFGIYPDSTTGSGTYREFSLMPEIASHNVAVIGAKVSLLDAHSCQNAGVDWAPERCCLISPFAEAIHTANRSNATSWSKPLRLSNAADSCLPANCIRPGGRQLIFCLLTVR
jgi:hypothetical protein